MPTAEERLDTLLHLLEGGALLSGIGPRTVVRGAGRLAAAHPYALAATLAAEGWIHREQIANVASALGQQFEGTEPAGVREAIVGREAAGVIKAVKRKVSKANKAVKEGMRILKSGTKAQTGSAPGILPAGAFKTATKAAGLANPKSKSIIGKGKSKLKKLARRLKKWW
jgi:hypothetical protein